MHPIFCSRSRLIAYIALWMGLAGLLAPLLRLPGRLDWREALILSFPLSLFYAFVCLAPWYACRSLPLRSTSWAKLLVSHFGAAVLAAAIWVQLARWIAGSLDMGQRLQHEIPLLDILGVLLYVLSVASHYTLLAVEDSREAQVQARDAELRALKAQINPHFLFNSLNSISALITIDPSKAREMCIRLSEFLRNTLGLGERESISWREELQLARIYLDVEQVRFGTRLKVEMDVDEECGECMIPPLVLQPLIENAVKHGIASMVDGGTIRVEGHIKNGVMAVSVENSFDPESPSSRRHGLGLRNVRSRLETRFGAAASLTSHSENNLFRAEMIVPCQRAE
jgi:two-component system sensor histidine kinase AlgZ